MDASTQWTREVSSSISEAESLQLDINDLQHRLSDVVHALNDLNRVHFPDDMEDYEVLTKATDLWKLVSSGVSGIQRSLHSVSSEIVDLKRAVEFYNH